MPRTNNGAKLTLNGAGIYEIRWTEEGRSKRVSTGEKSLQEAQRFFAGWLLDSQEDKRQGGMTAGEALDLYWDEHGRLRPNSARWGKHRAEYSLNNLRPFFASMPLAAIGPKETQSYLAERVSAGVKPSTVRRELVILIAAANHALKTKRIDRAALPVVPLPPQSVPRDRWITKEQAARLIEATAPKEGERMSRVHRFILLAVYTASRKRAIEELRWEQVDLGQGLIKFAPPGHVQSIKRRPAVPIASELMTALKRAKQESQGSPFVLDNNSEIRDAFSWAVRLAGLPIWLTPHVLRHSWATWAAQGGRSMWEIAGVLGDTMETVTKNYLHHCPDHLRSAVDISLSRIGA